MSYTLGANNIGMIFGSTQSGVQGGLSAVEVLLLLTVVAVVGLVTLGRGGVSSTVGDRMLVQSPQGVFSAFLASSAIVWFGTQLAIPVSISQCLLGGMIGAAYTKSVTVLNGKIVRETLAVWVVAPVVSFVLGFVLLSIV